MVVPSFFGTPFFIFLLRQYFRTFPEDLADAARVDAAYDLAKWLTRDSVVAEEVTQEAFLRAYR